MMRKENLTNFPLMPVIKTTINLTHLMQTKWKIIIIIIFLLMEELSFILMALLLLLV